MLAGAILGLVGSVIPEVIKIFRERQQHKQELEMLELQLKYQREMAEIRIAEAEAHADIELDKAVYKFAEPQPIKPTGKTWLDFLQILGNLYNQTVRPTLTYLIMACWLVVKFSLAKELGGLAAVWTPADEEFVAAVILFWFGRRAMKRTFGRKDG